MVIPRLLWPCLSLAAAVSACNGDPTAASGDPGPADVGPTADAALPDCDDDLGDRARGGVCIHGISGRLVSESGAPVEGATVTCCANACFYGQSGADGRF